MIELRDVSKTVMSGAEPLTILHPLSIQVPHGQFVAIVGPSGSGKSTLLALMAGLDRPTEGEVLLDGIALSRLSEDRLALLRREKVGFVFQSFQLLPALTALENAMLPLELAGGRDAAARARSMLERVGLGERLSHYPRQLSGGEQQRVAVARAFVTQPRLLFADEPTGNLDSVTGEHVIELLFEMNRERGATLVLVTHDADLARRCDRRIHIAAGEIVAED